MGDLASPSPAPTQRVDKWLWCARFFKSRSLATKFVRSSHMRVLRDNTVLRIEKPSFAIIPDDELTFSLHDRLRVIKIIQHAARRGPASEAALLYEDLSPPIDEGQSKADKGIRQSTNGQRPQGAGRPTKRDRRALDRLRSD